MKWIVFMLCLILPTAALALTVEGKNYEEAVTVEGYPLKLIGAGLREVYGFNVYTLGAYSQTGSCDSPDPVKADEVKYLRMIILRNIDAEKVVQKINEAFSESMPANAPAELIKKRDQAFTYFNGKCVKGTVYEFIYLPGKGTEFRQNGRVLGPTIPGKDYNEVFWNVWFGEKPCDKNLKSELLTKCNPEPEEPAWVPFDAMYGN